MIFLHYRQGGSYAALFVSAYWTGVCAFLVPARKVPKESGQGALRLCAPAHRAALFHDVRPAENAVKVTKFVILSEHSEPKDLRTIKVRIGLSVRRSLDVFNCMVATGNHRYLESLRYARDDISQTSYPSSKKSEHFLLEQDVR